jgi:hypothetical protein
VSSGVRRALQLDSVRLRQRLRIERLAYLPFDGSHGPCKVIERGPDFSGQSRIAVRSSCGAVMLCFVSQRLANRYT